MRQTSQCSDTTTVMASHPCVRVALEINQRVTDVGGFDLPCGYAVCSNRVSGDHFHTCTIVLSVQLRPSLLRLPVQA